MEEIKTEMGSEHNYTPEQMKALACYQNSRNKLRDGFFLVNQLKICTEEEVEIEFLKTECRRLRQECKNMNIDIV